MPNYWRDKSANDPAATAAHAAITDFDRLATPEDIDLHLLDRAQIFATLAVANQLSRLAGLAEMIPPMIPPVTRAAVNALGIAVRDLRGTWPSPGDIPPEKHRAAAPGHKDPETPSEREVIRRAPRRVPLDQIVCDDCGGDAAQPSITCPAPCHPDPGPAETALRCVAERAAAWAHPNPPATGTEQDAKWLAGRILAAIRDHAPEIAEAAEAQVRR